MHARSAARKQEILTAARALLIELGYEGTTIAKVAERAGAAVGSVTHFFKTKETLVATVAEEMIEAVAADAHAALQGHDYDVEKAVRSLLTASSEWPQKFSQYRRLTGYLEVGRPLPHGARAEGLQPRLEQVLAAWARPLVPLRRIAPLSSAELYAVILAPAVCDTTCAVSLTPGKSGRDWLEFLLSAVVNAIVPPKKKKEPKTEQRPSSKVDLFRGSANTAIPSSKKHPN